MWNIAVDSAKTTKTHGLLRSSLLMATTTTAATGCVQSQGAVHSAIQSARTCAQVNVSFNGFKLFCSAHLDRGPVIAERTSGCLCVCVSAWRDRSV